MTDGLWLFFFLVGVPVSFRLAQLSLIALVGIILRGDWGLDE